MSADGSHQLRLMESNGNDGMPAWSPTGEIAFYSNRDGNRELYLMEGLGTMPRRLSTNLGDDWFPAWSSDGRVLAFTSGSEIHVLDTTNQNISQLARFSADSADPIIVFAMIPHF